MVAEKEKIKPKLGDLVTTNHCAKYYPQNIDVGTVIDEAPPEPFEDYHDYVAIHWWCSGIVTTENAAKIKVLSHA